MEHFEEQWQSKSGVHLFAQGWDPGAPPHGVVCLVHGIGEHSGRYAHVAQRLCRSGYAFLAIDLYGHGRSGGKRGHVPSFETYLQDVDLLLNQAARRYAGKPRFLYGHSMGGLIVLNYVLNRKPSLTGVISTSPALRNALQSQTGKVLAARILGMLAPTVTITTGLDANLISRDPDVVRRYLADPLVHGKGTFGWGRAMLAATDWVWENATNFPGVPLLLVHGTADSITFAQGSQEFASQVPGEATAKLWEGLYHETHNEPEKEQVLDALVAWLDQHLIPAG